MAAVEDSVLDNKQQRGLSVGQLGLELQSFRYLTKAQERLDKRAASGVRWWTAEESGENADVLELLNDASTFARLKSKRTLKEEISNAPM